MGHKDTDTYGGHTEGKCWRCSVRLSLGGVFSYSLERRDSGDGITEKPLLGHTHTQLNIWFLQLCDF